MKEEKSKRKIERKKRGRVGRGGGGMGWQRTWNTPIHLQLEFQYWDGEWSWAPTHNQYSSSNWQLQERGKLVSLMQSHWVHKPYLKEANRWQYKTNSEGFLEFFVSYCSVWASLTSQTLLVFCFYIMVCNFVFVWVVWVRVCAFVVFFLCLFLFDFLLDFLREGERRCEVKRVGR